MLECKSNHKGVIMNQVLTKDILFNTFRTVEYSFQKEASLDPTFEEIYKANISYFRNLEKGMALSTFIQLTENNYGINNFKNSLQTNGYQDLYDILKYIRNAYIHGNWDISKLNFSNQEQKIRDYINNNTISSLNFPDSNIFLNGDIVSIDGLEPLCNCLLHDSNLE